MNDLISIIVPVYNTEKYLDKCIESIVNQTHKNLEIILVDDGSTDNSGKILDEWAKKDNRIKIIHKENGGVSSARNLALDNATGEYITFVDSDDGLKENALEILCAEIKSEDFDFVQCAFTVISEDEEKFEEKEDKCIEKKEQILENFFSSKIAGVCWGTIFNKRIMQNLRFRTDMCRQEDTVFVFNCCCNASKVKLLNQPLYLYYQRQESVMHELFNEKYFDAFKTIDEMYEKIEIKNQKYRYIVRREIDVSLFLIKQVRKHKKFQEKLPLLRERIIKNRRLICGKYKKFFSFKLKIYIFLLKCFPKLAYSMLKY